MKSHGNANDVVSEWEDNVLFDADDPDFDNGSTSMSLPNIVLQHNPLLNSSHVPAHIPFFLTMSSTMSVASAHQTPHLSELCSSMSRTSISMSSSLSDLVGSPFDMSSEAVITIEDLRAQMGSCFTCGVTWTEDQVSLDCSECGGYSLERPCMLCDGVCGQLWKRDFTMSHACGKARWQGTCPKYSAPVLTIQSVPINSSYSNQIQTTPSTCHTQQFLQQELCARLEKLSAKAHT